MQRFQDLLVWQRSHTLTQGIYALTASFPSSERFGLTSQLRRAAYSVPTNIVEGSKRKTGQEFARFLNIAERSLAEVKYLLILSRDLRYAAPKETQKLIQEATEIARMLNALRIKVERRPTI